MTGPRALAAAIRAAAADLGFARVGFASVERFDGAADALSAWLSQQFQGEMAYLAQGPDRADPRSVLAEAKTVVVVALAYSPAPQLVPLRKRTAGSVDPSPPPIAAYALGQDYHGVFKEKLTRLASRCTQIVGRPVVSRASVDTAPLLEREAARRSGVGFSAKSTMTIVPGIGTYVLLGELLLDVDVEPGVPIPSGCGTCTDCLDACPTQAFVGGHVLDARRCISYLTIELRGPIPLDLRAPIGQRVFGCDVCQQVCPFNASSKPKPTAPEFAPREALELDLAELLGLTASSYRRLVKDSALRRVSRPRLARNAAVAIGNSGDRGYVPALGRALERDSSALVRSHVAWALGRLGGDAALAMLERASADDRDPDVRDEAVAALAHLKS